MIYVRQGLEEKLAMNVAKQLSVYDRLGAHMRDDLGIRPDTVVRPMQAAWVSPVSFAAFAVVPIIALLITPAPLHIPMIAAFSAGKSRGTRCVGRSSRQRAARPCSIASHRRGP
jgi:VIT1/CCC1 family predicted Fe2+/Mn2+ transporter